MYRVGLLKTAPKIDGTSSTNYGPKFEVYNIWTFMLNCCRSKKNFSILFNESGYIPWDDIVATVDNSTIYMQIKHNKNFIRKEFLECLEKRASIFEKHKLDRDSTIFVFYSTSSDEGIKNNYDLVKIIPELIDLIASNKQSIYKDSNTQYGATYMCMNQNNITGSVNDAFHALKKYIGENVLSQDQLDYVQTNCLSYWDLHYHKLIEKDYSFITHKDVKKELSHVILENFKLNYSENLISESCKNFKQLLELSSMVVINHKKDSKFKTFIWSLLKKINPEIKESSINTLWRAGKLHMPIESPNQKTDDIILRALEIGEFEPKVIILRPTTFSIEKNQTVITLLQNLPVANELMEFEMNGSVEHFKFAKVPIKSLIKFKKNQVHQDSFYSKAKLYFKSTKYSLKSIVEAHDELNYINDHNLVNQEKLPAIFMAIRIKRIDIDIIKHIIKLGANVNASVEGDFTPIFYAIQENRLDIVNLLLQNGANPNLSNKVGDKPMYGAITGNKLDILKTLLNSNADREACDRNGVSPLFMAYNHKNYEALMMLLSDHGNPIAANVIGSHILHEAAHDNNLDCLKCVIKLCPNVNIFINGNREGKTPLDIAKEKNHESFHRLLHGAVNGQTE